MSVHCQADDERFSFEAFTRIPSSPKSTGGIVEAGHRARTTQDRRPRVRTRRGHQAHSRAPGWGPAQRRSDRASTRLLRHSHQGARGNPLQGGQVHRGQRRVGVPHRLLRRTRSCSSNAIHLVPDKAQVIGEIRKTLNKDARLRVQHDVSSTARTSMARGPFGVAGVVRAVQVLRGARYRGQHSDRAVARQFLTPEEYSDLCVQAGFARPSVDLVRIEMPHESMREHRAGFPLFIEGALPRRTARRGLRCAGKGAGAGDG